MKKDYCDITILLDKSGSMETVKQDTIGGINSFITDQSKVGGKCRISLYQFDDKYETTYENLDILVAPKDAIAIAKTYGINQNSTITYIANSFGKMNMYHSLSSNVSKSRACGQSISFTDDDRKLQEEALTK